MIIRGAILCISVADILSTMLSNTLVLFVCFCVLDHIQTLKEQHAEDSTISPPSPPGSRSGHTIKPFCVQAPDSHPNKTVIPSHPTNKDV